MTYDEQLQVNTLYQNAMWLLEQRDSLRQEVETQRLEITSLKGWLGELCDELEELKSRNWQSLMACVLIVGGADMGIARERMTQMIRRMNQSIALLELQHSIDITQLH